MTTKISFLFVLFSLFLGVGAFGQNVDYAGTKPDAQTVRVVTDDVLWGMVAPLEKKQNATCKMTLSDTVNVENPHWVCLNNETCSYAVVVKCFDNVDKQKQKLRIEISGLDDQKTSMVQTFTVYYLSN